MAISQLPGTRRAGVEAQQSQQSSGPTRAVGYSAQALDDAEALFQSLVEYSGLVPSTRREASAQLYDALLAQYDDAQCKGQQAPS